MFALRVGGGRAEDVLYGLPLLLRYVYALYTVDTTPSNLYIPGCCGPKREPQRQRASSLFLHTHTLSSTQRNRLAADNLVNEPPKSLQQSRQCGWGDITAPFLISKIWSITDDERTHLSTKGRASIVADRQS
ncbi:hypothetical protein BX666DRAFT_577011 [Dichotomocladium elegans]|nr:hypothetical protein BX666DRAFT_577011 [Dichotomocladium elegans]